MERKYHTGEYIFLGKVFTTKQTAKYIGAHVETIRRLARRGDIPSYKVGKDWRFWEDALKQWIESHYHRSKKSHILIVDDDNDILELTQQSLNLRGYRVSTAIQGLLALDILRNDPADLVLLDLVMPEMNGPQTLKEIRKLDAKIPVIIITGYPDSDILMEALQYSPFHILLKPFKVKRMIEIVDQVINGIKTSSSKRNLSERR